MIRNIIIFFMLLGIFLIGLYTKTLREENFALHLRVQGLEKTLATDKSNYEKLYYDYVRDENLVRHGTDSQAKTTADLEEQLKSAKLKLEILKENLAKLKGDTKPIASEAIDKHIIDDQAALAKAESQLAKLNDDGKTVTDRSKDYRGEQDLQLKEQKARIEAQMQYVAGNIHQVQEQIQILNRNKKDPNRAAGLQDLNIQLSNLHGQHAQLKVQHDDIGTRVKNTNAAIGDEVRKEQDEIKADREQVKRDLNQIKADLESWKKQRGLLKDNPLGPKIKAAELEITQQADRVRILENMLRTLAQHAQ